MTIYRPKAREMAGFNKNWDTEDVIEAGEERTVNLQQRMQEYGAGEKTREGRSTEGDELQPHQWGEEGNRKMGTEEEEMRSLTVDKMYVQNRREGEDGGTEVEEDAGSKTVSHENRAKNDSSTGDGLWLEVRDKEEVTMTEERKIDNRITAEGDRGKEGEDEEEEMQQQHRDSVLSAQKPRATESENRWVLGASSESDRPISVPDDAQEERREEFQRAFTRNMRKAATQRIGTRIRKPTMFSDEVHTDIATKGSGAVVRKEEHTKKMGENKRYGSINVRTLVMKGDKHSKEACGKTAAVTEWVIEFENRGLGIIGLQECRIPSGMDGCEGSYRTFYAGMRRVSCNNMEWESICKAL